MIYYSDNFEMYNSWGQNTPNFFKGHLGTGIKKIEGP